VAPALGAGHFAKTVSELIGRPRISRYTASF
jgi:hypothetical protein